MFWGFIAIIADGATDDGIVLLLDEAIIVFAIGATPGEGDLLVMAVPQELVVDEL